MTQISVNYADLPQDVREAIEKSCDRTGVGINATIAFFVREGARSFPNPAPWNISEQEVLKDPNPKLVPTGPTERDQFLFDVFVTACEGGINDWSSILKYHWRKKDADTQTIDGDTDYAGYYAEIVEDESDESPRPRHRIDAAVIEAGLKAIREKTAEELSLHDGNRRIVIGAEGTLDAGTEFDAESANWVVQAGLFGQVIYG